MHFSNIHVGALLLIEIERLTANQGGAVWDCFYYRIWVSLRISEQRDFCEPETHS